MATHPLIDRLRQEPSQPAEHGEWCVEAEGATGGHVGLQADALRLRRATPSPRTAPDLAEKVAERATYLLDPLRVVEAEPERALLRSQRPPAEDESLDYYDVWVTPRDLSVERYHAQRGTPRERRPLNLTWEQAERLARDVERAYEADEAD